MLEIDGSFGEGGGQVLRTCLSLSALTGRPFRIYNIRAGRQKPGLRPQHLTTVRAVAALCSANTSGAALNSRALTFRPQSEPLGGEYHFDVAAASTGGSAGSVGLILQAMIWPLLFAQRPSTVRLIGGTHVPYSPAFHFLSHVFRPALHYFGADVPISLKAWGWYPTGQGEIEATITPLTFLKSPDFPMMAPPSEILGIAAVTNLPAHIPQRMSQRASELLVDAGLTARIEPLIERSAAPGAGIFLWTQLAGFSCLGRPGLPAEKVAESVVADCLAFIENRTLIGRFLTDQLLLPMALAHGQSKFTTSCLTAHTLTNVQLLQQWLDVEIKISGTIGRRGQITIDGTAFVQP